MIETCMSNVDAMQMLKRGEFLGELVEFSTNEHGITTVKDHTEEKKEKGEK